MHSFLRLRGLALHNLKDIDLDLPLGSIVAITGPSGAGKSTLALDTIYAEAQRRYVETFSPYVRQFFERLPRPPARAMENLQAALAISVANPVRSARSTVATLAEITYPARYFFFRQATLFCPSCGRPVYEQGAKDIFKELTRYAKGEKGIAVITAQVKGEEKDRYIREGFFRGWRACPELSRREGEIFELRPGGWDRGEKIEIVVDRLDLARLDFPRISDSSQKAFSLGKGLLRIHLPDGSTLFFSKGRHCPYCSRFFRRPNPNLFSFNSPIGACKRCQGFGRILSVDWDLVIPDKSLSIEDGAIRPLENWEDEKEYLLVWCKDEGIPVNIPWLRLSEDTKRAIISGRGRWYGVEAYFEYLEKKRYKAHVRIFLSKYRAYLTCPECKGTRFVEETGWYRLEGLAIHDFYALSLQDASAWLKDIKKEKDFDPATTQLMDALELRISTLCEAGLSYLTLDRQSRTLSGGEVARVKLSRAIGSELSETMYILDEPSAGLHPVDTARLAPLFQRLKSRGNSLFIVEQDPIILGSSDLIVALGPGAGKNGGEITYSGHPEGFQEGAPPVAILKTGEKHTVSEASTSAGLRAGSAKFLTIKGARANNLKDITVSIPLEAVTCVSGVSGSGKSTFLELVLYRGLLRKLGRPTEPPGEHDKIKGLERIKDVQLVDQTPIGRTPRGCPGSYLHVLDGIRSILAGTDEAKLLDISPSGFSFNVQGGRCENCKGQGFETVEMQFLPDLMLPCPMCKGRRFNDVILSVQYKGKNIDDILRMTLGEASHFFKGRPSIQKAISPALYLDIGHLAMGQPINTLSGGEAQRLKLARIFQKHDPKGSLFLLDEPSRGLHRKEVALVIKALKKIAEAGCTIVIVDHHPDILNAAHWVTDLGPHGGDQGGKLLYQGPPEGLSKCKESLTGRTLSGYKPLTTTSAPSLKTGEIKPPSIEIKGARHHNLKDIDITIPKGRFVVITGVSGSGKSSLAFDIIFSEGQRRYIEGLSSYMKQFIKLYERPDVDEVAGLTPTVSIEQRTSMADAKSTVATLTEVAHYLRLLYAKSAYPVCPSCGKRLEAMEREKIFTHILKKWKGKNIQVISPAIKRRKGWHQPALEAAVKAGIKGARVDGEFMDIPPIPSLSRYKEHTIEWVFGPVAVTPTSITQLLNRALTAGKGELIVLDETGVESHFSKKYSCKDCGKGVPSPDPLLFSFHTRAGQCPSCSGMGKADGQICKICNGTRLNEEAMAWKIAGLGINEIMSLEIDEALKLFEKFKKHPPWEKRTSPIVAPLVQSIITRLGFLRDVGLGYLALDRSGNTLSGGEAQRIRLSAQVALGLTGLTIVLDEPTIGLHPQDNKRLLKALKILEKGGNTVIVVEHDEETIRNADWVIDLGPGGGKDGGRVVAQGMVDEIINDPKSQTGICLKEREQKRPMPPSGLFSQKKWVALTGISSYNIKDMDISFPMGCFIGITGVSGSGKSALLEEVIAANATAIINAESKIGADTKACPYNCKSVTGLEEITGVAFIDHSPIGRTPRSCPATYVGFFGLIRELISRTPAARSLGFTASRFSFNLEEGRCKSCKGHGMVKVSLGFLPDVYMHCEDCGGDRYEPTTLSIEWNGKNMAQILDMTISEARDFFRPIPELFRSLSLLCDLGLGYLTLGQPSPTLSGGEAQRIKIARELIRPERKNALYLLDEPTTGLHMSDVRLLADCLKRLVDAGNTVIVIEHNMDLVASTDWIIDLGPGGGKKGGELLFSGPPAQLLSSRTKSATREALEKGFLSRQFFPECPGR